MTDEMLKRRYSGTGVTNYNELRQHSSRWRKEHEMVRAFLLPHKGKSVLDLPVGTGRFAEIYKELDHRAILIDQSSDMLAEAIRAADRVGYHQGSFRIADAATLEPKDIKCDVGVCIRFLNWLPPEVAEKVFTKVAAACRDELIVSLTSIDEAEFDEGRRLAIECWLANAHSKPRPDGLPPNAPHSWTAFKRWVAEAGYEIADSVLILKGKRDFIKNHIHHLVRRRLDGSRVIQ